MNLSKQITTQFRELYYAGNWVAPNLKEQLKDVTFEEATTQVGGLNTILKLTYHIFYYVDAITKVLKGGPLQGSDKLSFNHPEIANEEEWQQFLSDCFAKAEEMAKLIEDMPDEQQWEGFGGGKYGSYYRNITGNIEHTYYHMGQIALLKKLVRANSELKAT